MAVTKEQVERYAEAVIEYDDARHAVTDPDVTRWSHSEPVITDENLERIAKAVGGRVETRESERFVTSFFEAYGVEFIHVGEKEGGGA